MKGQLYSSFEEISSPNRSAEELSYMDRDGNGYYLFPGLSPTGMSAASFSSQQMPTLQNNAAILEMLVSNDTVDERNEGSDMTAPDFGGIAMFDAENSAESFGGYAALTPPTHTASDSTFSRPLILTPQSTSRTNSRQQSNSALESQGQEFAVDGGYYGSGSGVCYGSIEDNLQGLAYRGECCIIR